jgi:hypothetical protein
VSEYDAPGQERVEVRMALHALAHRRLALGVDEHLRPSRLVRQERAIRRLRGLHGQPLLDVAVVAERLGIVAHEAAVLALFGAIGVRLGLPVLQVGDRPEVERLGVARRAVATRERLVPVWDAVAVEAGVHGGAERRPALMRRRPVARVAADEEMRAVGEDDAGLPRLGDARVARGALRAGLDRRIHVDRSDRDSRAGRGRAHRGGEHEQGTREQGRRQQPCSGTSESFRALHMPPRADGTTFEVIALVRTRNQGTSGRGCRCGPSPLGE